MDIDQRRMATDPGYRDEIRAIGGVPAAEASPAEAREIPAEMMMRVSDTDGVAAATWSAGAPAR